MAAPLSCHAAVRKCQHFLLCSNFRRMRLAGIRLPFTPSITRTARTLSLDAVLSRRDKIETDEANIMEPEVEREHDGQWEKQTTQAKRISHRLQRMRFGMRDIHKLEDSRGDIVEPINELTKSSVREERLTCSDDFYGLGDEKTLSFGHSQKLQNSHSQSQRTKRRPFERYLTKNETADSERVFEMSFGSMRLDSYNRPTKKFADKNNDIPEDDNMAQSCSYGDDIYVENTPEQSSSNYIDHQYFEPNSSENIDSSLSSNKCGNSFTESVSSTTLLESDDNNKQVNDVFVTENSSDRLQAEVGYLDQEYFGNTYNKHEATEPITEQHNDEPQARSEDLRDVSNYFDQQYFSGGEMEENKAEPHSDIMGVSFGQKMDNTINSLHSRSLKSNKQLTENLSNIRNINSHSKSQNDVKTEHVDVVTKQEERLNKRPLPNLENPKTAYDMAMKIRLEIKGKLNSTADEATDTKILHPRLTKWSGKVDSKGFRILKDQVMNFDYVTEDVLVNILHDSILYDHNDVVAIYKPYGLACHGGPGVHHSIGKLLPRLAHKLDHNLETLHLIHRLDKDATGVLLLSKTEQMASKLHGMFKRREIIKKYWVLTKGIPNPLEGVIDIPMAEGEVEGRIRMKLRPDYTEETKMVMGKRRNPKISEAITNYRVLATEGTCALVECQPESGVKHQLRCHLAFGLNTPILGDHKYSHPSRIAPQRLYPDMLQRLGIRQPTVRYVPLHLHAKMIVLPELYEGRNVFISARLPKHFSQNMKWLKIHPPE